MVKKKKNPLGDDFVYDSEPLEPLKKKPLESLRPKDLPDIKLRVQNGVLVAKVGDYSPIAICWRSKGNMTWNYDEEYSGSFCWSSFDPRAGSWEQSHDLCAERCAEAGMPERLQNWMIFTLIEVNPPWCDATVEGDDERVSLRTMDRIRELWNRPELWRESFQRKMGLAPKLKNRSWK